MYGSQGVNRLSMTFVMIGKDRLDRLDDDGALSLAKPLFIKLFE
jgi:hypothetical protein